MVRAQNPGLVGNAVSTEELGGTGEGRLCLRKTGTNISEAKSRHSKILRNTLPDVFHAYFPFYLYTRVINGKIDV